jgi:hypothetical protein
MDLVGFALWGFLGAFVYAAPRLLVAFSEERPGRKWWFPLLEFAVALAFGPIGASGFTQIVADVVRQTNGADLRAIALVIGMVANPLAPSVVHLVGEGILRHVGAPLRKRTPP